MGPGTTCDLTICGSVGIAGAGRVWLRSCYKRPQLCPVIVPCPCRSVALSLYRTFRLSPIYHPFPRLLFPYCRSIPPFPQSPTPSYPPPSSTDDVIYSRLQAVCHLQTQIPPNITMLSFIAALRSSLKGCGFPAALRRLINKSDCSYCQDQLTSFGISSASTIAP